MYFFISKIKSFLFENKDIKQTIAKNSLWLVLSESSGRLFKMALIIYAARILGTSGWGVFSYALSVSSILMIFSDTGLNNFITREIIQKKEKYQSLVSTALLIKSIVLIISVLLVIFISPLISQIKEAKILFPIVAAILFFESMRDLSFSINRAFEKMEREMIVKTIMSIIILFLGVIFLIINPVPESIAIAYAIGSAIGFIAITILIKKDIKGLFSKIDKNALMPIIKIVSPFAIIALIGSIMANTDIFMLGIWKDSVEIGLYASAQRMQQFILIIPSVISVTTFPIISRLANNDNKKFGIALEKTISLSMLTAIPIAFGGLLLTEQIILLVFGPGYILAAPILRLLMLMLLVSFPLVLLSSAIFAYNRQKNIALAYLFGIISNISLNYFFIPILGATGAALATLISTAIITLIIWRKMKMINYFEILPKLKKIIASSVVMALSILILQYLEIKVVFNIIISSSIYFVILLLLKEPILKEVKEVLYNNMQVEIDNN